MAASAERAATEAVAERWRERAAAAEAAEAAA